MQNVLFQKTFHEIEDLKKNKNKIKLYIYIYIIFCVPTNPFEGILGIK